MASRLDQIVAATRRRVSEQRGKADLRDLERKAKLHDVRGLRQALERAAMSGPAVIAELKKASPSRGLIRSDFDAATLAVELQTCGAAALSVLTDEEFFQGSLENLRLASTASGLPCLRKDFIVDELQIVESRANQADSILLIVAALSDEELVLLSRRAWEVGLDVLCEVHDERELERALEAGCDFIGVNSRDLRTFEVDLSTAVRLGRMLPKEAFAVAESGIHSGQDIARLWGEGYKAFLIGESLMKETSPGEALRKLLAESRTSVSG
jgi:indole-3-glycerol phosphate synthase